MSDLDPRAQKTVDALHTALVTLLRRKSLDEIAISELAAEAKINRSTFYVHYNNVAQLYEEIEAEILTDFKDTLSRFPTAVPGAPSPLLQKQTIEQLLAETFAFLERRGKMAPVILSRSSGGQILQILLNLGRDLFLGAWQESVGTLTAKQYEYFYTYVSSGIISLMRTWYDGGMEESPQTMAELTYKFMNFRVL